MLNIWDAKWGLELGLCPCDLHFVEMLADRQIANSVIYHFGSGGHHLVGVECMKAGKGNMVISITAAPQEEKEYEKYNIIFIEKNKLTDYICFTGQVNDPINYISIILSIFNNCIVNSTDILKILVATNKGDIIFSFTIFAKIPFLVLIPIVFFPSR